MWWTCVWLDGASLSWPSRVLPALPVGVVWWVVPGALPVVVVGEPPPLVPVAPTMVPQGHDSDLMVVFLP